MSFTPACIGLYVFELRIDDRFGGTLVQNVTIEVPLSPPEPPTAQTPGGAPLSGLFIAMVVGAVAGAPGFMLVYVATRRRRPETNMFGTPPLYASSIPGSLAGHAFPGLHPALSDVTLRQRQASWILAVAAMFHVVSIPIALLAVKIVAESVAGRSIGWSEFFDAADRAGVLPLLVFGLLLQALLAIIVGIMAVAMRIYGGKVAPVAVVIGVLGVLLSFLIMGGFVGAIGGILYIVAGIVAWPRPPPPQVFWPMMASPPVPPGPQP